MVIYRYSVLLFLLFLSIDFANAQVDSLEKLLPVKKGREKVYLLSDLSWEYSFSDLLKAEKYANECYEEAKKLNNDTLLSEGYNAQGIVAYRRGELEKSIQFNLKALEIRKRLNDKSGIGSSKSKIGNAYVELANFDEALKWQLETLEIFEELGNKKLIGQTLNNISQIHKSVGNNEKFKFYVLKALSVYKDLEFAYGEASAYGNLSIYYQRVNQIDSAFFYAHKSSELFEQSGAFYDLSSSENNLGFLYRYFYKDNENGLKHYTKATELAREINDLQGLPQFIVNMAIVIEDMGDYPRALNLYNEALELALANGQDKIRRQCYEGFADTYESMGELKKALQYRLMYIELNDSIFNLEKSNQIAEMEAKYQVAEKDKAILETQTKLLEAENEAQEKKIWVYSLGGLSLSVLLTALLLIQRNKRIEKGKRDSVIIAEREAGIKAVFEATEEERKRIAKDLHDGVGQQMSGLKMAWQNLSIQLESSQPEQTETLKKLTQILDEAALEVRSISHQMMPRSLSELGLVPSVEDMLQKAFLGSKIHYNFESHRANQRFDERIEIGLYRVCQELINNVIKHSSAMRVSVQLFRNNKQLILIVEDDGVGFDVNRQKDGIGLLNMSSRLNTFNGRINFEPSPGSGTTATIRIPL
ncbi:MAG: tetratricopeptide repeat protein [Flavobacteriales bacterium]